MLGSILLMNVPGEDSREDSLPPKGVCRGGGGAAGLLGEGTAGGCRQTGREVEASTARLWTPFWGAWCVGGRACATPSCTTRRRWGSTLLASPAPWQSSLTGLRCANLSCLGGPGGGGSMLLHLDVACAKQSTRDKQRGGGGIQRVAKAWEPQGQISSDNGINHGRGNASCG